MGVTVTGGDEVEVDEWRGRNDQVGGPVGRAVTGVVSCATGIHPVENILAGTGGGEERKSEERIGASDVPRHGCSQTALRDGNETVAAH